MTWVDFEYRFEELPVRIDGGTALFSGHAYLEPDPAGFWVGALFLDGENGRSCQLSRGGSILARHLFAAIEEALYDEDTDHGKHAREAFAAHMEGEKSDAA